MESLNKKTIITLRDSIFDIAQEIKEYSDDLFNKLMGVHDELENLFFTDDDKFDWPMEKYKFCREFGYNESTFATHVSNLKLKERKEYWVEGSGRRGPGVTGCYISQIGAIKILQKSKSEPAIKYLRTQGMNIPLQAERYYLDIIENAVQEFDNPIKKKAVEIDNDRFEIDLYLEKSKLAVECDEQDHAYKNPTEESSREEAIEKKLGCKFLRFNPDELDFNIGKIINIILSYILDNKKINGMEPLEYYQKCTEKRKIRIEQKLKKQRPAEIESEIDLDEFI
jgi:hypothetical protein